MKLFALLLLIIIPINSRSYENELLDQSFRKTASQDDLNLCNSYTVKVMPAP